jgi:hypothetical protein
MVYDCSAHRRVRGPSGETLRLFGRQVQPFHPAQRSHKGERTLSSEIEQLPVVLLLPSLSFETIQTFVLRP